MREPRASSGLCPNAYDDLQTRCGRPENLDFLGGWPRTATTFRPAAATTRAALVGRIAEDRPLRGHVTRARPGKTYVRVYSSTIITNPGRKASVRHPAWATVLRVKHTVEPGHQSCGKSVVHHAAGLTFEAANAAEMCAATAGHGRRTGAKWQLSAGQRTRPSHGMCFSLFGRGGGWFAC